MYLCVHAAADIERVKGKRAYITLDRTIFHPLSGGQPSDEGVISNNSGVFEVKKVIRSGSTIRHWGSLTSGALSVGDKVICEINWEKRYKVMRLHTAGHILDYAMLQLYGELVETLNAYHGPPESYLEYNVEVEPNTRELERLANEIVSRALYVVVHIIPAEELDKHVYNAPNLLRLPEASKYRIVEIPGVNAMPCTGTHVLNTKEVGKVHILRVEKSKGYMVFYDVV
ncbi:MAG: alanyl-tRNA editing protein [Thermofilaceae archaeon]